MIRTDKEWKQLVKLIADSSPCRREDLLEAAGYLWDSSNWTRLSETIHGKFIRECHNSLPDLSLRSLYRKEVQESQE